MKRIFRTALIGAMACLSQLSLAASPIKVVAAENFYGDVAQQIGGKHITVVSILNNPEQDPHLFEANASVAKSLSSASLVIYNGIDYDPWMNKLLTASPNSQRQEIVAGKLANKHKGDNPHLWYAPETMPLIAKALTNSLSKLDPANAADYSANLKSFLGSLDKVNTKIAAMRKAHQGTSVTATEPVFGYMADALKLNMLNGRFQIAVMNDTEPTASDIAAFEKSLKSRQAKVLIYNNQVVEESTKRLLNIAKSANVPVVGVTETSPAHIHYQDWMTNQLEALDKALQHK